MEVMLLHKPLITKGKNFTMKGGDTDMKKKVVFLMFALSMVLALSASPVIAASFSGTPSPSLSPVFGTLVDFDDQATGTPVNSDDYVSVGVASITETEGLGTFARYAGGQSQPNYVGTGIGGERGTDADMGWDGTILIELTNPTNMIGIGIANSQGGPEVLSIYDAGGTLLETSTAPSGSNVYTGFSRSTWDIKYLKITGDFFAIDDLQFNPSISVDIDIKPGSFPNSINLKSKGVIPVAILTTDAFDALSVDAATVAFGPDGASPAHEDVHIEDVDYDGDLDMVLHFKTQETGIAAGDTEATLTGQTLDGVPIVGSDSVRTVPMSK